MTGAFSPGALVRVRNDWPETHGPVHVRTPHYLRGIEGRVVRQLGTYRNPEDLAFGRNASAIPLYHVAFDPGIVWPDGDGRDRLLVEIFEHWMEPVR